MIWDVFNNQAFSAVNMTEAVNMNLPPPMVLGAMGEALFPVKRIVGWMFAMEQKNNVYSLIPNSPRHAPPVQLEKARGQMIPFATGRRYKSSTLYVDELTHVLDSPETMQLKAVATELAERNAQLQADHEITAEHQRLGAIKGVVYDADGTTEIFNAFTAWGETPPTPVDFELDDPTTNVRLKSEEIREAIILNSDGSAGPATRIVGLCGKNFFNLLVSHAEVAKTYFNWAAAVELRGVIPSTFNWGGIDYIKYYGTLADATLAIDDDECRFFPVETDAFLRVQGNSEFQGLIREPGRDFYAMTVTDKDRQEWITTEVITYPMYMVRRPKMLRTAISGA